VRKWCTVLYRQAPKSTTSILVHDAPHDAKPRQLSWIGDDSNVGAGGLCVLRRRCAQNDKGHDRVVVTNATSDDKQVPGGVEKSILSVQGQKQRARCKE